MHSGSRMSILSCRAFRRPQPAPQTSHVTCHFDCKKGPTALIPIITFQITSSVSVIQLARSRNAPLIIVPTFPFHLQQHLPPPAHSPPDCEALVAHIHSGTNESHRHTS